MGYLDNTSVTVDAILTLKGRQLLAKGPENFKITQFALGDDEVDYSLWNTDHPLGTDYYGIIIENMPLVEAIPDETQALRSKLITLPKQTKNIPKITVGNTSITLSAPGQSVDIKPSTINLQNANSTLGYTAILSDSLVADIKVRTMLPNSIAPTTSTFVGENENAQSVSVAGMDFTITAKRHITDQRATLTIIGNETGGSVTINVLVKAATTTNP